MTLKAMRTIDRFAGIPLCWITGIWLSLSDRRYTPQPSATLSSVLVMKFFGLGSLLLSTPFLSALRRFHPDTKIIYLTFESNRTLLDRLPQPDIRLTISTASARSFLRTAISALRTIRRKNVQVVFDLEFFSKFSTLVSALSRSPVRVGYELPARWRRMNLTHPVPLEHAAHVTEVFLNQLKAVVPSGIACPPVTSLGATHAERISMQQKLSLGANGARVISVNINAGATSYERRWDPRRFVSLVNTIRARDAHSRFFFVGSRHERSYVEHALQHDPDLRACATNCAGDLTLGELIALLQRSEFLLTNDSGTMHIAAAAGTRVVALFGPESPRLYGPSGISRVIYKAIPCSPCLNVYTAKLFACPYDAQCMKEILVEEVVEAVEQIRSETTAAWI